MLYFFKTQLTRNKKTRHTRIFGFCGSWLVCFLWKDGLMDFFGILHSSLFCKTLFRDFEIVHKIAVVQKVTGIIFLKIILVYVKSVSACVLQITGLILIMLAFLTSLLLLLMYKAMWYDRLTCPQGFILQVQNTHTHTPRSTLLSHSVQSGLYTSIWQNVAHPAQCLTPSHSSLEENFLDIGAGKSLSP